MAAKRRPLIAGNWKMNGLIGSGSELQAIIAASEPLAKKADLLICPPATLVAAFASRARGSVVAIGGQDCHPSSSGAHTGDISAEMLKDAGAWFVITGHSERRADHSESSELVRAKVQAAWRAGLVPIVCVGETEAQRKSGQALDIVGAQLAASVPDGATAEDLVVAYEPVWAIGTGLTPTIVEIEQVHGFIRNKLSERFRSDGAGIRVLYGGSVKPSNAAEILRAKEVNGALIGGASLKATDFFAIAAACP
jgi:triosephosphate isomerase (TIM)